VSVKKLLGALMLGMGLSAAASSAPLIDQQFVRDIVNNTGIGQVSSSIGQTFTVGLTGTLTGIDVFIAELATETTTGGLTLDVRSVSGSGAVEPLAANALASATIPDASVPFRATSSPFFTPILVDLSAAGLAVTAGDILAFVLTRVNGDDDPYYVQTDFDAGYLGGTRVSQLADGDAFFPSASTDLTFRTYVETAGSAPVPLPSTLVLIGLGLAGFGWNRRRA
jgi:hypothetical protein